MFLLCPDGCAQRLELLRSVASGEYWSEITVTSTAQTRTHAHRNTSSIFFPTHLHFHMVELLIHTSTVCPPCWYLLALQVTDATLIIWLCPTWRSTPYQHDARLSFKSRLFVLKWTVLKHSRHEHFPVKAGLTGLIICSANQLQRFYSFRTSHILMVYLIYPNANMLSFCSKIRQHILSLRWLKWCL